jgi:16S rRNA (guanine527-N7)-methyltransferase
MDLTPTAPWRTRLRDLTDEWSLPASAPGRLGILLERLAADDRSPTTVRDPAGAVDTHVADALSGLAIPAVREADTLADLGAGAGIPSLVLAAARPDLTVLAVESVGKKATYIEQTAQAMGLDNVTALPIRAEDFVDEPVDVVTARALAPLAVLVEYAAPILREGGALVAWKGVRDEVEEEGGRLAGDATGLEPAEIVPVTPFPGARDRSLHLYLKVRPTPNRFPRRPGMARKRPLGPSGRA